jgi:RNA polymerase sigma-B factor
MYGGTHTPVAGAGKGSWMAQHTRSERDTATGRLLVAYHGDGDDRARERLVTLYLPLVEALANRYGIRGAEHEDLVQVGSIGLLNAIERFDPRRGEAFTAFAVPTIVGEIKRHLRDRSRTVRLPRRLEEASSRLPGAREHLTARLGRAPSSRELAEELGVAEENLPVLESPAGLPEDAMDAATDGEAEDHLLLTGVFDILDDTERQLVYLRFVRELSRREAADELGITADQLRRRTREALAKLRAGLEGNAFANVTQEIPGAEGKPEPEETVAPEPKRNGGARPAARPRAAGERSGRILVRVPPAVHDELAEAAAHEGVSLNQFITDALGLAVHPERSGPQTPRWLPAAIVTDIIALIVASIGVVIVLLMAWQQGW